VSACIQSDEVFRKVYKDQDGYPLVAAPGRRMLRGNRVVWEECFGEIPPGMMVCHRCDNPWCVSPEHLFLGTADDNNKDKARKGRAASGDSQRTNKKISKLIADNIRSRIANGEKQQDLADEFGLKQPAISNIKRGRTWR
jgi:hypothetical protein